MHNYYNIAMVGAGNLAWNLAPALENNGHRISMVFNRTRKNALLLIEQLYRAELKRNLNFSNESLDLIIIAVNDNSIKDIASEIILPENCQLVHTSGSQSMNILERSAASSMGVFYPLHSFTKGVMTDFREVPVFLESSTPNGLHQLKTLSKGLTKKIFQLTSPQRRALHLSAVIATNFSNHLFTLAKKIMDKNGIDFNHLQPLSFSMIQKIFTIGPEAGQTGPAIRNDLETIDEHLEMLENEEDLVEIYSIMSKNIQQSRKRPKKH